MIQIQIYICTYICILKKYIYIYIFLLARNAIFLRSAWPRKTCFLCLRSCLARNGAYLYFLRSTCNFARFLLSIKSRWNNKSRKASMLDAKIWFFLLMIFGRSRGTNAFREISIGAQPSHEIIDLTKVNMNHDGLQPRKAFRSSFTLERYITRFLAAFYYPPLLLVVCFSPGA